MAYETIIIIPARSGSKRLPKKNIMPFNGKPMLSYTIESALSANINAKIIVSTDDETALEISLNLGVDIHRRPTKLANDTATVVDVCLNVLQEEEKVGHVYKYLICLYPTAPLRTSDDIDTVFSLIQNGSTDFAMAVSRCFPSPHQALYVNSSGYTLPLLPELINMRSSDLPIYFVDNGSTYASKVSSFINFKTFYGPNLKTYLMPRERSVDIDDMNDFELAQWYSSKLHIK